MPGTPLPLAQYPDPPAGPQDADLLAQQECYGTSFSLEEVECMTNCGARDRCIRAIAHVHIPMLAAQKHLTVQTLPATKLVEFLSSSEATAGAIRKVIHGMSVRQVLGLETEAEAAIPEAVKEATQAQQQLKLDIPESKKKDPPMKQDKKKTAKVKPAKPVKASKPPKQAKVEKTPTQPKDASAKKAKSPPVAAKKVKPSPKAKAAKAPTEEAALSAWNRERSRSAWVASLKAGQEFTRQFDGHPWTLRVQDHGYEVEGQAFSTVYAATVHVVGSKEFDGAKSGAKRTMPVWSSQRFWTAKKAGKKLPPKG